MRDRPQPACALLLTMVVAGLVAPGVAEARMLSYVDLVRQLTDLDRLTVYEPGVTAGQYSSWDRGERTHWGANGDAGQYLRVEPNGEAVMMDQDGPGCIFRTWSANPQGKIRIYLDGATTPTYEWDFNSIFQGDMAPFIKPIVYKRDGPMSASDCYLPIPFAKHIRITADRAHGQYYHFDYLRYPSTWRVKSFHLPLAPAEDAAVREAARAWGQPGTDPKPRLPGQQTMRGSVVVTPGHSTRFASLVGPGEIRALRLKITSSERYAQLKIVLRGVWDGASEPQLAAPVGPFLGYDWSTPDYGSLVAGCHGGWGYFYYPMPFRHNARLELDSHLKQSAIVEYEVEWAPTRAFPTDGLYFYAKWRSEPYGPEQDYPILETAGKGHFVGVTLQVDHPLPGWWGEGDEKVWVDGDQFPPWIGTGSEDYFGDAWGIRYLTEPSFGCSLDTPTRTCPYRWHFVDRIPFSERIRMTIENYGSWDHGMAHEFGYSSVAYWYQAELVPPWERLRPATYIGGKVMGQKPEVYHYDVGVFAPIAPASTRTTGLDLPWAYEGETLAREAVARGTAAIVDDTALPYEWSGERAVSFGTVAAGKVLSKFVLCPRSPGVYYVTVQGSPGPGTAPLELAVGGRKLEALAPTAYGKSELGAAYFPAEGAPCELSAAGSGQAVLDCIQLVPAERVAGAIEAEDLKVVRTTSGAPRPEVSSPGRGLSAGRALAFHARRAGDGMILRLPTKPANAYILGIRPVLGPDAGIVQAFANGKPVGVPRDLYAAKPEPSPRVLPLGPVTPGSDLVELRVVGKNPASSGWTAELDYLRFEPKILHPDSAPGVSAEVLRTHGCSYQIQDLGPKYIGGHHLWLQPSSKGAWIEIELDIPTEGDYALEARYTTSWDYAIIQASLDGKPLGGRLDLYSKTVEQTAPQAYGRVSLTAGRHTFRLDAVDHNPGSAGFLAGLDYLLVRAAR